MAIGSLSTMMHRVRGLMLRRESASQTDGRLLDDFLIRHDQSAFERLVERHGPMVLGVCRRVLGDPHEAEDAFQATFLVLVRKGTSVVPRELVGNWLYGVAYRTALKARAGMLRRRTREKQVSEMPSTESCPAQGWHDLQPLLDQELHRLPECYRIPMVLCALEGRTREDAARMLGIPEGTLSSRLSRARELLSQRLTRRGVALSAGTLASVLSPQVASATVPASLVLSTVQAAALGAAAEAAAAGVISAKVAALTEGVIQAMFISKLKVAAAVVLAIGVMGAGVGVLGHRAIADKPAAAKPEAAPVKDVKKEEKAPDHVGQIAEVSEDKKSIVITIPANKGGEAKTVTIKLGKDTKFTYYGVGEEGQKPTVGYGVRVWLADGSADTAAALQLGRKGNKEPGNKGDGNKNEGNGNNNDGNKGDGNKGDGNKGDGNLGKKEGGPTLAGTVRSVNADKNTVTLAVKKEAKQVEEQTLTLAKDFKVLLSDGITKDGEVKEGKLADLTEGTSVYAQLSEDKKSVVNIRPQPQTLQVQVKSVDHIKHTITFTTKTKDGAVETTLKVAKDAKVLLSDGLNKKDPPKEGELDKLTEGTPVMLRLSVIDKDTVRGIQVSGRTFTGSVKGVDVGNRTITINVKEDGQIAEKSFTVAKNVRMEGALGDLVEGTNVSLTMSVFDAKCVIAINVARKSEK
ncbi:MAG: RNA polymerase sigma factor [Gemmataceae bacterium]|nr:RNA polymerase sigma factor [Gemmataceae bacterium]